jgi:trehalose 6-phosphate phosphatase
VNAQLLDAITTLARTPVLLVASDFDGTLAELAARPEQARAHAGSLASLRRLGSMAHTHVSIISGRELSDLRRMVGEDLRAELVGTHGAEVDGDVCGCLREEVARQLDTARRELELIAAKYPDAQVEPKSRGVAFHYRRLDASRAGEAVALVTALEEHLPDLTRRMGSMVVEYLADRATKGDGLLRVRHRCGATGTVFIGDDLTDEHAFGVLGMTDLPVKVGAGDTRARFRVANVEEVAWLLERLCAAREEFLRGLHLTPIEAHSVLSDQRTLGIVSPRGRVVWLCLPRIDSPAIFAELLDGPAAGYFEVCPEEPAEPPAQSYEPDSMVLRTRWRGCEVIDYLDCGFGRAFQRSGRSDLIRVIEGTARCVVRFAPRLDFGRVPTRLSLQPHGLEIEGSADPLLLYAPGVEWRLIEEGPHQTAEAVVDPSGGPVVLELRAGSADRRPHPVPEAARRQGTVKFWSTWARSLQLPGVAAEQVKRSALMIRALVHGPSGAIAAAGTTSLPEHLGGVRNWDYRYCWPRDAAMAARALVRLGNTGTAMRLLDWLGGVLDRCESPDRLRPIYLVDGQGLGSEAELGHLTGYGGSRPVRLSNAAAQQVQLDVFGPIADLVASLVEQGAPISPDHWRMTRAMVEAVSARWRDPDHGIWEVRARPEHHVHTKVMCFHTVDRALLVHEHVTGRANRLWEALREEIRQDVLTHGYKEALGAFCGSYETCEPDAAALTAGLTGLVEVRDPRFQGTLNVVLQRLTCGAGVYRYRFDDGLPGREGTFHLCTGWLIEALALSGRRGEAELLFRSLLSRVGPTGVMSEEYEPQYGLALGNIPQAYSHLALINAAVTLDRLYGGESGGEGGAAGAGRAGAGVGRTAPGGPS